MNDIARTIHSPQEGACKYMFDNMITDVNGRWDQCIRAIKWHEQTQTIWTRSCSIRLFLRTVKGFKTCLSVFLIRLLIDTQRKDLSVPLRYVAFQQPAVKWSQTRDNWKPSSLSCASSWTGPQCDPWFMAELNSFLHSFLCPRLWLLLASCQKTVRCLNSHFEYSSYSWGQNWDKCYRRT